MRRHADGDSQTPLHKWFFAMFLFSMSRHGVSAKELQRQIGVTCKCAWRMAHRIRQHMRRVDDDDPLDGVVEVDETYVSGRRPGKGSGYRRNKSIVLGRAERGGRGAYGDRARRQAYHATASHPEASRLQRHGAHGRAALLPRAEQGRIPPRKRDHSRKEYVRDHCHVNSLEGFWARVSSRSARRTCTSPRSTGGST